MSGDDRYERGLGVRREVLGDAHVDRSLKGVSEFARPVQEYVTQNVWGEIWSRPGLDRRTRSLLNLVMLTALNRNHELGVHVRGAVRNGCSTTEIQEALLQAAGYCGAPAALESFRVAERVLDELAAEADGDGGTAVGEPVGFVGLGRMGAPMVRRLAAGGVAVRGYDAADGVADGLSDVLTPGGDAAAAVAGASAVILMLPDSDVVESVVDGGLLDALEPGALLVDMSTSEPVRTRELEPRVAAAGATLVDAPVSGGVSGARDGTLTIMVGGPDAAVRRLEPMLGLMGRVRHVGACGAGHALKALNNLLSASHLLATSEAILAGERFGLDPAAMLEAINSSSGRSGSTDNKWPNHIVPGTYASGFTAGLMLKDLRIALGLAEALDAPRGHAERTAQLWARAVDALGPAADHTEIARWLRERPEEDR